MARQDDPSLSGDIVLLRRIPPYGDRVTWGEDGTPSPSSMNFKDPKKELSVHIATETTIERVLAGHPGFRLICFTIQQVREACGESICICRDDLEPDFGHILICGKIGGGAADRLKKVARWVEGYWPWRQGLEKPSAEAPAEPN